MKPDSMRSLYENQVNHCPARVNCPFREVCGISEAEKRALSPAIQRVEPGDIVWNDIRAEHRVIVIKSGICSLHSNPRARDAIVCSLFGQGDDIGFAEMYLSHSVADMYYLRALTEGELCSFPAKPMRRHLDQLSAEQRERIIGCTMANHTSAMYVQVETLSKTRVADRIMALLIRLDSLTKREGVSLDGVRLTHAQIAELVASDRVSVSRALRKMEQEGLVRVGYRSVKPGTPPNECDVMVNDYSYMFHRPDFEGSVIA